jgi:hypothetical protein
MRDPKRISPILDRIARVWENHPDMRLGQIIMGATSYRGSFQQGKDLFYIEDEELVEFIERGFPVTEAK